MISPAPGTSQPTAAQQRWWRIILGLHEVMFALNIASAFGFTILLLTSRGAELFSPENNLAYYCRRGAYRINDLLHVSSRSAVSTNGVARGALSPWNLVGYELVIAATVLSLAIIILALLRCCTGSRTYRTSLSYISCVSALFLFPACFLYVTKGNWDFPQAPNPVGFWRSPILAVFAGEILCSIVLFLIGGKRPISAWTLSILLFLHYAFWTTVLSPRIGGAGIAVSVLFMPYVLVVAFPLSGIAWLLYLKASRVSMTPPRRWSSARTWTLASTSVALLTLALLWSPSLGAHLSPKDFDSLRIELSRGSCFGSCPAYKITVLGNGRVEYIGEQNVRVAGLQTSTISSRQVASILQSLNDTHFLSLDDRAFDWCFDTPSVSVSVSVDGRTKRVVSDADCFGAKSGIQARFVHTAAEIDKIVGSERWVPCNGGPCWRHN